jgi:transposase
MRSIIFDFAAANSSSVNTPRPCRSASRPISPAVEPTAAVVDREVLPVVALRGTPAVHRGEHKTPTCEHGEWRFAGADRKRKATKWRCPTGERKPTSVWIKADRLHPLIPRETLRSKGLYRRRASVERAFGRLKNEWGLTPLRVRRLERVQLHADLTILSQLTCALSRERGLAVAA